jgi:hypothetical protein
MPAYTVIVWAGIVFLQCLPPKRFCYLGQCGYVFILYCSSAWMSNARTALVAGLPSTEYDNEHRGLNERMPVLTGLGCQRVFRRSVRLVR